MKHIFILLSFFVAAFRPAIGQDSTFVIKDSIRTVFLFPIGDGSTETGSVVGVIDAPQKFKIKPYIAPAVCVFISGMFDGAGDYLQFHYDGNSQFWQPDISWKNKYKNHDPSQGKTFAGKYLVFTTDGWHLMKFGRNLSTFAGISLMLNSDFLRKKKWYWYIAEGMGYWAINRAGFHLTYNIIFR